MKVISTNIGKKQTIRWKNKTWETGIYKKPLDSGIFLGKYGVEKDTVIDKKHHGGEDMAVYAFSKNHYPFFEDLFDKVNYYNGIFGENLTIQNFNEKEIQIGDTFKIGEAIIQVSQPRLPCRTLNAVFQSDKMMKSFINTTFSGAYFRVLQEGVVRKNDTVTLVESQEYSLSLATVFSLFTSNKTTVSLIQKALSLEYLSERLKKDIKRKLL